MHFAPALIRAGFLIRQERIYQALTIGDERLEESIRDALEKPVGPLETEDFLRISGLTVTGPIADLRGIEHLHNLEVLAIRSSRA